MTTDLGGGKSAYVHTPAKHPIPGQALPNGATCLTMYSNGTFGVVLATTKRQPVQYVTWTYNVEQGARSTCLGRYTSDFEKAKRDFLTRVEREHLPLNHGAEE